MAQNFLNEKINRGKALTVIREVKQNHPREVWSSQMRIKLNEVFKEFGKDVIAIVVLEGETVKISVRMNSQVIFTRNEIEGVLKKPEAAKEEAPKVVELGPPKPSPETKEVPNAIIGTKDEIPKAIETKEGSEWIIRTEEEEWRKELLENVISRDENVRNLFNELRKGAHPEYLIQLLKILHQSNLRGSALWQLFSDYKKRSGSKHYGALNFMNEVFVAADLRIIFTEH